MVGKARGPSRSIVRRIPIELDEVLIDLKKKNELEGKGVVEPGKLAADMLNGLKSKKRIIENIRRQIEF